MKNLNLATTTPAILSLCLPGLGQVVSARPLEGLAWFALFAVGLAAAKAWLLIPLAVAGSSWRCACKASARELSKPYQVFLTLTAFGVFFLWMSLAVSRLLPASAFAQ